MTHIPVEQAEALMPAEEHRQLLPSDNPEYTGYDGTITSAAEIDRLVQPLLSMRMPQAMPALAG
jgi:hypothetical protein